MYKTSCCVKGQGHTEFMNLRDSSYHGDTLCAKQSMTMSKDKKAGSWMYLTHPLMVIDLCAKYGMPMSIFTEVTGRTWGHDKAYNFDLDVKGQYRIRIINIHDTSYYGDTPMYQILYANVNPKKGMGRKGKRVKNPINLTLRNRGKIELNYLFSWLLQCNLLRVETKASANAFGFSISNNIFPPQRIVAIYPKTRVLILKSSVISEISFHWEWNKISSHKKCMEANDESKENWIIKTWEKGVFY